MTLPPVTTPLKEIEAGPNAVEVAGVEMSVAKKERAGSKWLEISYRPGLFRAEVISRRSIC
ncbi:MAG: PaRep2b protein [Pyrobaculum sp.]|jgi:hypothetical protein|nr:MULTISPECIES: PaRep2b protein [Pyrobaculum]MCX8136107.1 PaRep2b protein [Pyrobaculum aerophilum]MCY0891174.1 PaRep2b protein [Pyrobaculum arsenaticum]RFA93998.1 hypothetical protein CGL51_11245 [Pyrobaculum aerophilum]RFB00421.1 hypothetical protein CGL52_00765 [Pyrobaculum aerophilum]